MRKRVSFGKAGLPSQAQGDILQVEDGQESVDGGDTAQVAGEDGICPVHEIWL